jgi:transcriptional regulator with XRE-family HTH domain
MFTDRLNELVRKNNVTRYQVAKATGVTEATLSNYSKGKGASNTSIVKQLAEYFGVDFEWLMYGEGDDSLVAQLMEGDGPVYQTKHQQRRTKALSSSDLAVIVKHFEKQLNAKDELIRHLMTMIDDKLNLLLEAKAKRNR